MMNKTELIKQLIDAVDEYANVMGAEDYLSLQSFAAFLSTKQGPTEGEQGKFLDINIAKDFAFIYRYSRSYVKRAIAESTLQTLEEYTYLATLLSGGVMTKTELNNANAMEKTSGTEIIHRLLKKKLISQQPSNKDRRSMDVSITEEGRQELFKVFGALKKSAVLLTAPLKDGQKILLSRLQHILCKYNHDLFLEQRDAPLDELIRTNGLNVDTSVYGTGHGTSVGKDQ
ncbi:MAG: MarR family winged helix-turn-helix transcriptional regulator [Porphyromonas sp.]|nr:MarR family winged helix-turn-helix transcriptional regulator [Porphyromonas sp.]